MRIFFLSVVLLFSYPAYAKFGWNNRLVSVGYSYNIYSAAVPAANCFSILYERDSKSCTRRWRYRCYKFHYFRDNRYVYYHAELNLTPWRGLRFPLTRKCGFQLTTDLHLINSTDKSSDKSRYNLYVAPGMGLDFNYRGSMLVPVFMKFRVSWQYNYNTIAGGENYQQVMFSVFTGIDVNATKRLVKRIKGFRVGVVR